MPVGELRQVHEIYSLEVKNTRAPPKKVSDLTKNEYAVTYPGAVEGVRSGRYVVLWGTPPGSSSVLAYEKAAPQDGGLVVLANGDVKTMAAAELNAALKGEKK